MWYSFLINSLGGLLVSSSCSNPHLTKIHIDHFNNLLILLLASRIFLSKEILYCLQSISIPTSKYFSYLAILLFENMFRNRKSIKTYINVININTREWLPLGVQGGVREAELSSC